jgi:putative GTP pyrophosphokinase
MSTRLGPTWTVGPVQTVISSATSPGSRLRDAVVTHGAVTGYARGLPSHPPRKSIRNCRGLRVGDRARVRELRLGCMPDPNPLPPTLVSLGEARRAITRMMVDYQSGLDQVTTKLVILQREFERTHSYNPIEHVYSRLKSLESILDKAQQRGGEPSIESVRALVTDIAGVRVICGFTSDVYRVQRILCDQPDITLGGVQDYIASPKTSGYRSLHLQVEVPVFLSAEVLSVPVEVQIRTIAMDFWATLEHKIAYKYGGAIPDKLRDGLTAAAYEAAHLDDTMENLNNQIRGGDEQQPDTAAPLLEQFLS